MTRKTWGLVALGLGLASVVAYAADSTHPFEAVPPEKRESLERRVALYVKYNRTRDWARLYDLVSDLGRGGINHPTFVALMKAAHGKEFASSPNLLEFRADRTMAREDGGYDIYGCGEARREGEMYRGIAVMHAMFEHYGWFFTGWSFTEFPNEPCKGLSSPGWQPENRMGWDQPMEEVRSQAGGVPVHVDKPK